MAMAKTLKRSLRSIFFITLIPFLTGCGMEVVALTMAANLAATEVLTGKIMDTASVDVSGSELRQFADWKKGRKWTEQTGVLSTSDWSCADGQGANVCAPREAVASGFKPGEMYRCRYGEGGPVSALLGRSRASTLYCERS